MIFLGFVFGRIFGHAPVLVSAVLSWPIHYGVHLCGDVFLLSISLRLSVAADLAGLPDQRRRNGMLNGIALRLFLVVMAA